MVLPQGLGIDVLRALNGVRLWDVPGAHGSMGHFSVPQMGPRGTLLGYTLQFHRVQPSQGLDIRVPWASHFVKTAPGSLLFDVMISRTC